MLGTRSNCPIIDKYLVILQVGNNNVFISGSDCGTGKNKEILEARLLLQAIKLNESSNSI